MLCPECHTELPRLVHEPAKEYKFHTFSYFLFLFLFSFYFILFFPITHGAICHIGSVSKIQICVFSPGIDLGSDRG